MPRRALLPLVVWIAAACTGAVSPESSGGAGASGTDGNSAGAGSGSAGAPSAGAGNTTASGGAGGAVGGSGGSSGGAASGGIASGGMAGVMVTAGSGGVSGASGAGAGGGSSGGVAGAGGVNAGAGGAAGSGQSGSGTAGAAGAAPATPSSGCGTAPTGALAQWVEQPTIDIRGVARRFWVWLPEGYDPERAYPVIFLLHGCGNESNNVPMQRVTGDDAVLVRSVAVEDCWETSANGPDVELFVELVAHAEAGFCLDTSRRFAVGYSSGSWLINTIECAEGGLLRAAASVAGGTVRPTGCSGRIARLFVHDLDDNENDISGSVTERDRLLEANGCDAVAEPVPEEPAPCARYQGCDDGYPVIWCETTGEGHDRQDDLASEAAWGLFTEL